MRRVVVYKYDVRKGGGPALNLAEWRSAPRPALGRGGGGCPPQPADACTMPMTLFTSKVLEELLISRGGVETTVL